jgi:hypothetical protein
MEIHINLIGDKLMSIFTSQEPNTMITYYMVFIVGLAIIRMYLKKRHPFFAYNYNYESRYRLNFHYLLLLNFIIFFMFPAMTYGYPYLNWRYISYFTPVYLTLAFIPFAIILKCTLKKN